MIALASLAYSPADHATCEVCQTGVCWCATTCDGYAPGTCPHGVSVCVDCTEDGCVSCRLPVRTMSLVTDCFLIPIDPEDLDATRPEDIDVCTWCMGSGFAETPIDMPWRACSQCHGTGERGAR